MHDSLYSIYSIYTSAKDAKVKCINILAQVKVLDELLRVVDPKASLDNRTLLHEAAGSGHTQAVVRICKDGPNVEDHGRGSNVIKPEVDLEKNAVKQRKDSAKQEVCSLRCFVF